MSWDYEPYELENAVKAVKNAKMGGADIKPRELLLAALAELMKPMCQATDLHSGWHRRDIESHIVTIGASQEEMRMKLIHFEDANKWFREYGCTICDLGPDGYELTDCADSKTGGSIVFGDAECSAKPRAVRAGTFHTHQYGLPTPSYRDIMSTFIGNLKINFIGGCVEGHKVLVGYAPHPESAIRWEMKQRVEPMQEFKRADIHNVVNFVYLPPGATSAEAATVKQFGVYDEDEVMDRFVDNLEYLDGIFEIIVHWWE